MKAHSKAHSVSAHPFALMMNPQAVLEAMERSERLQRLDRRVCRPLDKPLLSHATPEVDRFDHDIDEQDNPADAQFDDGLGDE